jgi:predicted nucleic acid-binding protein
VVYAELSVRFETIEALEAVLADSAITVTAMPRAALFLAGKVFQRFRASGGKPSGVLLDFFIGAHAAVTGLTLLTRDARRYRRYFPTVELVTP